MPPDRPHQPHDGLIRTALDSLDNARSALAAALPRPLLAHLDLPDLAPGPHVVAVLEDLAQFSPEALAGRPELSVQLRVTYFLLQRSRSSPALEGELALIVGDLRALSANPAAHDFLARLLRYTFHTANGDIEAVHGILRANLDPTMETQMGTLAEQLIERGVQKGRAEGIQAGRAEGIQAGRAEGLRAGQRETLTRLLTLKFGPLSSSATERLATATSDELATYTLRVLGAESLDAVFQ